MSTKTQDADVIFNRVNVALAQSQKLVQSWLSPANNGKEDQEDLWTQKTEGDNDFEIAPESLGLGAAVPKNDAELGLKRRIPKNEELLEQILGKKAARAVRDKQQKTTKSSHLAPSKQVTQNSRTVTQDDASDVEEGRAGAINSNRKNERSNVSLEAANRSNETTAVVSADKGDATESKASGTGKSSERKRSYLDEMLDKKSKKKSRKT